MTPSSNKKTKPTGLKSYKSIKILKEPSANDPVPTNMKVLQSPALGGKGKNISANRFNQTHDTIQSAKDGAGTQAKIETNINKLKVGY